MIPSSRTPEKDKLPAGISPVSKKREIPDVDESQIVSVAAHIHTSGRMKSTELRNIERVFNEFDEDHSGTIDIVELQKVMEAMGHNLAPEQLAELLEQVDVSHTGAIELNEFVQLINLWKEASQFKLLDSKGSTLQEERIERALRSKWVLPDSQWRGVWDVAVMFCILYLWITALLGVSFKQDEVDWMTKYMLTSDIMCVLLLIADVGINFITCYTHRDENGHLHVIDDIKKIAVRYVFTWLVVDALASVPFNQIRGDLLAFRILSLLRLLKALKIPKLFRSSGRRHLTPGYVNFRYTIVPLVKNLIYFLMFVHLCSVIWVIIKVFLTSTLNSSSGGKASLFDYDTSYTTGLYFVMTTLTTCGYGDVAVEGALQQIFASILCVCGTLLQGIVIGLIVSVIQKTDIRSERKDKLRETLAVCQYFGIPHALQEEILQFQNHVLEHNLSQAYTDLVRGLPQDMQININLYVRIRLVSYVPYFGSAHQGTKVALAQELLSEVYRPEEYIIIAGEEGTAMYFISYGFVDVISVDGVRLATLKQGGYFGEMALLSAGNKRNASVKALTYCDIFRLNRSAFMSILRRFPKFRKEIIELARKRRKALIVELSNTSSRSPIATPQEHFLDLDAADSHFEEPSSPPSFAALIAKSMKRLDEGERSLRAFAETLQGEKCGGSPKHNPPTQRSHTLLPPLPTDEVTALSHSFNETNIQPAVDV